MDRIWLKNYPKGVPAEIDATQYASIVALMEESFAQFGSRQAFVCMDKAITYAELDAGSRAIGAYLQSLGLVRGDRVALMMPNILQYPVSATGVLRAGFAVVNVNPLYTPRELEHQLKDSGAKAIIILENFAHTLEQVITQTDVKYVVVARLGDMLGTLKGGIVNLVVGKVKKMVPAYTLPGAVAFKDVLAQGRAKTLQKVAVGPDDVAFLQYTGGTTGVSKGATLLHRNVVANMLQNDLWLKPGLEKSGHIQQINIVTALPLYHIFALTACMLLAMRVGGKCILIPNPRDIPALIKDVSKHKVHVFPALNTLFIALMNHPDFGKLDLSELRFSVGGGMATQKAVAERWQQLTKKPLLTGYGLSETSPTLTVDRSDGAGFTGSIGYPVPSTDISIRDDDGGEVPLGQPGEICARGPQVMAGYWNRPDETAKVMTTDGFFRTGDIGVMDANGQITIVDRKKDMIIVSGFNVYPNEIEDVVAHLPGVAECAVIGVPDDRTTEAVMLFIVKKDPSLTEQKVRDYCAENLTNYKRPKHIVFRTELPKTNVGKILRRALRDQLEQEKISA